jgi:hypothetical protein
MGFNGIIIAAVQTHNAAPSSSQQGDRAELLLNNGEIPCLRQICWRVHSRFLSQIQRLSQYALLYTRVKTPSAMGVQMGKMILRQCGERTLQMRVGCEVNKETLSDIKLEGQVESSWGGQDQRTIS